MRIHASLYNYPPISMVGAWITTHEFLRFMVERGHTVTVDRILVAAHELTDYEYEGVHVLGEHATPPCDLIISHLGDKGIASDYARERQIPSVRMVHGQQPQMRARLDDSLVVFNSQWLEDFVKAHGWLGHSIVCHPPVDPHRYRTTPGDKVTLVNMASQKGGNIFWRLATACKDIEFLGVVGGYGRQIDRHLRDFPNVTLVPHTDDMRQIYSRTRTIIMPSAKETWGRVAVEAMASGIPTIAHATPGLVESLGNAGTFADRQHIHDWIDTLNGFEDTWDRMSELSLKRSVELDPTLSLNRFADAVEALV